MERAKRRHIQKCVKESSAEQIMNRLFKILWDTVKEGHDPTAFSQKAWGSCTTYTACLYSSVDKLPCFVLIVVSLPEMPNSRYAFQFRCLSSLSL